MTITEIIWAHVKKKKKTLPLTPVWLIWFLHSVCYGISDWITNSQCLFEAIDALYPPIMARGTQTGFL